jgi:lipopolysaccharide biosynthesis glycosyltransferase
MTVDAPDSYHFAFAAEGAYSLPLATTVASLLESLDCAGRTVTLWILDLDAETATQRRIERVVRRHGRGAVRLEWLPVANDDVANVPTSGHLVPVTYARLLLPSLLPADLSRVIYLDADLVVVSDLSALHHLRLDGHPIAAVRDFSVQSIGSPRSGIAGLTAKPADAAYFNAGVIVMNLSAWRSAELAGQVLEFASRHAPLPHADQDALNAVLTDWYQLPPRWNVQSNIHWLDGPAQTDFEAALAHDRAELLGSGAILHFSGPGKPWATAYRNPDARQWRRRLLRSGALSPWELARWSVLYYPRRCAAWLAIVAVRGIRAQRRNLRGHFSR